MDGSLPAVTVVIIMFVNYAFNVTILLLFLLTWQLLVFVFAALQSGSHAVSYIAWIVICEQIF